MNDRKPAASAALAFVVASAFVVLEYRRLSAASSHTGATLLIPIGAAFAAVCAGGGWLFGRAWSGFVAATEPREKARHALVASLVVGFFAWQGVRIHGNRVARERIEAIRAEALTPERAKALMSGTVDERAALAWNRSTPPELLTELARDPDYGVRASAAGNPSTPAAVAAVLANDPNSSVRLYASFHPSLKK